MYSLTTFTAAVAAIAPLAAAYTTPVGDEPQGNPIYTPGLGEVVPVDADYTIVWDPTTEGTVTLVLLKGPAENAIPQYAIVENCENNGSYVWNPEDNLEPGTTGYGIQLIDDETGQYQYTTQFGIQNDNYDPSMASSSSSSAAASSTVASSTAIIAPATYDSDMTASASATHAAESTAPVNATTPIHYTTEVVKGYTTYCPSATSFAMNNQTYTVSSATTLTITDCPCTITKPVETTPATSTADDDDSSSSSKPSTQQPTAGPITNTAAPSAGYMPGNGTNVVKPTGSMTVPSSLRTTFTAGSTTSGAAVQPSESAISTGGANGLAASLTGLVVAAGVAVLAL